jgi:methylated-DNA-[protein]-cysteine S-methyltransferase
MELFLDHIESPLGGILLAATDEAVYALDFADCRERMERLLRRRNQNLTLRSRHNPGGHSDRVRAYLAGRLDALDDIRVETGGTPFQRRVWSALRKIRPGKTFTYGALAETIGQEEAARAVGAASGRNPIALILPCHRVVGANGSLTGYAGGIARKRWLLRHEGVGV